MTRYSICSLLIVTGGTTFAQPPCFYSEDFGGGNIPAGWDIGPQVEQQDNQGNGLGAFFDAWYVNNSSVANIGSYFDVPNIPEGNLFLMTNDDAPPCNCDLDSAAVVMPTFDLSTRTNVSMEFRTYFNGYFGSGDATVEASVNGGVDWTQLTQIDPDPSGWQDIYVDLSTYDGTSSLLIRFTWDDGGNGNWSTGLAIDDICLRESFDHDLNAEQVFLAEVQPEAFSDTIRSLEYTMLPLEQVTELVVGMEFMNRGANPATNVELQINVMQNGSTQATATSAAIASVPVGDKTRLFVNTGWVATAKGEVNVEYTIVADADDDLNDNTLDRTYRITGPGDVDQHAQMATDLGVPGAALDADGDAFAAGVRLEAIAGGTIYGASVVLDPATEIGAEVNAQLLYGNLTIITTSSDHVVTSDDLTGDPLFLPFTDPYQVQNNEELHVVIANDPDDGEALIHTSGTAQVGSAVLFNAADQTWYYPEDIPMVRAQFAEPEVGIGEVIFMQELRAWPIPCNEALTVMLPQDHAVDELVLLDGLGRPTPAKAAGGNSTSGRLVVNTSELANGMYTLLIRSDQGHLFSRVSVQH